MFAAINRKNMIRRAESRDLPAVNHLLEEVLSVHHEGRPDLFAAAGKKYSDEDLLSLFANPETPVFVYEREGSVLGYAFCEIRHLSSSGGSLMPITTLYIDDLCVDVSARGQHIGSALYAFVKAFAREQGCHNITLHVWECNASARAFYDSLGLHPQYTSMEEVLRYE